MIRPTSITDLQTLLFIAITTPWQICGGVIDVNTMPLIEVP
jgi:hypothetical protein